MRSKPASQQRPESFHCIHMNFMESVSVIISCIFAFPMVHALVLVPPSRSVDDRLHIHRYRPEFPAEQSVLSEAQWFSDEHWETFGLQHPHFVESFRRSAVFPFLRFRVRELPSACFCALLCLFQSLLPGCLYGQRQHRLHQIRRCLEELRPVFFYHTLTKLGHHLLNVTTVQFQLFGYLAVRQVQAHKIETQYPDPDRLMMPGKNCIGQVVKAFRTIFTFIALFCRLFVVKSPFDDSLGIAKRAFYSIGPTQSANSLITLGMIDQIFYIYLHLVASYYG